MGLMMLPVFSQSLSKIGPGKTWFQSRTIIDANTDVITDSLRYLYLSTNQNYGFIESLNDSIADHLARLNSLLTTKANLANPTFTGVMRLGSDTIATRAYARSVGGTGGLSSVDIDDINATGTPSSSTYLRGDGTWNTPDGSGTGELAWSDTSTLATQYYVQQLISDSLDAEFDEAELGIAAGDTSIYVATHTYVDSVFQTVEAGGISDSTSLFFYHEIQPIYTFSAGHMRDIDSTIFMDGYILGSFFNRSADTIVITNVVTGIYGGANDTMRHEVMHAKQLFGMEGRTKLMGDGNIEVGADEYGYGTIETTDFENDTIPPDVWVWALVKGPLEDVRPKFWSSTMSGYKIKGTWNDNPFNLDRTLPELASLELGDYNDSIIVATFNETMNTDSVPPVSAFTMMAGNVELTIASVGFNAGDSLLITLDTLAVASYADSTLTLSHTPASPYLQDVAGNRLAAFDSVVVNNLAPEPLTNMIQNGTFDSGDYWTGNGSSWSIAGGVATFDQSSGSDYLYQIEDNMIAPIEASTYYTLSYDMTSDDDVATIVFGNSTYAVEYYSLPTATPVSGYTFKTPSSIGVGGVCFRSSGSANTDDFTLDNVVLMPAVNLISNGSFTNADDWNMDAVWTIDGGVATYDDTGSGNIWQTSANMNSPIQPNTTYVVDITVTGVTPQFAYFNADYSIQYPITGTKFTTPADIGVGGFLIRGLSTSGSEFFIDNLQIYIQQ